MHDVKSPSPGPKSYSLAKAGLREVLSNISSSSTAALVSLVAVTAIWGSTFLLVKNAISRAPVMDFLAVRFALAAAVMFALRPNCLRGIARRGLLRGVALGAALGAGYVTQTYGLLSASPSVSGFITGTFVVFTPVASWVVLRRGVDRHTLMGVALALAGVAVLGLRGRSFGGGELLTLACALFFALQIVGLGEWASRETAYGLAFLQIATVAVVCMAVAAPSGLRLPAELSVWGAIVITAILATALAFFVQTWAQSLLAPTHAAVVMTMEPMFAGIFGVVFGGDNLTLRVAAGFACILAAMLFVQISHRSQGARNGPG